MRACGAFSSIGDFEDSWKVSEQHRTDCSKQNRGYKGSVGILRALKTQAHVLEDARKTCGTREPPASSLLVG